MSRLKRAMNSLYVKETKEFFKKYNQSINYINLKSKKHHFEKLDEETDMDMIFQLRSILNIRKLERILYTFKQLEDPTLYIKNLIVDPYDFIDMDPLVSLLTYNQALKIETVFGLSICPKLKFRKCIFSMFTTNDNPDCDIYIEKTAFREHLIKMIKQNSISDEEASAIVDEVCIKHKEFGKTFYTTKYFNDLQASLTNTINENYIDTNESTLKNATTSQINTLIKEYELENPSIKFNKQQINGIHNLVDRNSKIKILNGPPGTGKTTITDCAIYCLRKLYLESFYNIILTAPTGKATNNLLESCPLISKETPSHLKCNIIKLILSIFKDIEFYRNNDFALDELENLLLNDEYKDIESKTKIQNKIERLEAIRDYTLDLLIIDESSMINIIYMDKLFKQIGILFDFPEVWFIGDVNQLEPIGGGFPFKDLINCKKFSISSLTEIKRCKGHLKKCIEKITNGDRLSRDDFDIDDSIKFIDIDSLMKYERGICRLKREALDTFMKQYNLTLDNNKFISPQKSQTCGVFNLNKQVQALFNTNKFVKKYDRKLDQRIDTQFKIQDIIIRTKNVYNEDGECYVNGDTAKIIDQTDKLKVIIKYDKERNNQEISVNELEEEFINSMAFTVHKAQGSGYDNIVLFVSSLHNFMWTRNNSLNLLYTAISRAKKRCFIIGDYSLLLKSQENNFISRPSVFMK